VVSEIADAGALAAVARQVIDDADRMTRIAQAARDHAARAGQRPEFAADSCLGIIEGTGSTA